MDTFTAKEESVVSWLKLEFDFIFKMNIKNETSVTVLP